MMEGGSACFQPDWLTFLCCTACHNSLESRSNGYYCPACNKEFPAVRNVVRFVEANNYADNFGYQWGRFNKTQLRPEFSEPQFEKKTGLRREDLQGKTVLDVGCGMGRFADVATRWGARVVGIDLSAAAEEAARNLSDRNFVALQADVFSLPFAPESFDCIYSVGVLHHTPNCEAAFKQLPQYLKPGGAIAVWLYSGYNNWYRFSDIYRKITCRVPAPKLHRFFRVVVPVLYWLDRRLRFVPLVGKPAASALNHVLPVNRHPDPEIRMLDTLDWYSPTYQSKHTYEQVFRWFESCGLENLTVGDVPIAVKGRKPQINADHNTRELQFESVNQLSNEKQQTERPLAATFARQKGLTLVQKARPSMRWLPSYAWQKVTRRIPTGKTHLIIALADHFEPAIVPHRGSARASYYEQEERLASWCREYPKVFGNLRDDDGCPFVHTYFYPAEQYEEGLVESLATHSAAGWGEIEIHLHHGLQAPDTEENTRRLLLEFRDRLAFQHGALSYFDDESTPRYVFVHGNFALANSLRGRNCGVDSEMQILSDTGCYAEMTLPPGLYHSAHIPKINSLYECTAPLSRHGAHRTGRNLRVGIRPTTFPLMIEGPLTLGSIRSNGSRGVSIENGSLTRNSPPSVRRLQLWKRAGIRVQGRPEWLFIKLQCHGMDPRDREVMLGASITGFLNEIILGAPQRSEVLHFVTAREMTNIILAACDGREGNPGGYRDYRLKRRRPVATRSGVHDRGVVLEG